MRWRYIFFKHPAACVGSWGHRWILKGSHTFYWLTVPDQGYQGWRKRLRTTLCPHLNTLHDLVVITSFKVQSPSKYYTRERIEKKMTWFLAKNINKSISKVGSIQSFIITSTPAPLVQDTCRTQQQCPRRLPVYPGPWRMQHWDYPFKLSDTSYMSIKGVQYFSLRVKLTPSWSLPDCPGPLSSSTTLFLFLSTPNTG